MEGVRRPPLSSPGVSADIMPVAEQTLGAGQGCEPFNANSTQAVKNNIALMNRGVCGFAVKAKNAQNAGARGVIIANNAPGSPPPGLGGVDASIVISRRVGHPGRRRDDSRSTGISLAHHIASHHDAWNTGKPIALSPLTAPTYSNAL